MFSDIVQSDPTASEMMQCRALFFVMMNGKTNQFNHVEYAAMLRAKEVDICCVGSVALYLFLRFHCTNEAFPNLSFNTDWFDIKLLKSRNGDRCKEISATQHFNAERKVQTTLNIRLSTKTHTYRHSAAKVCQLAGVRAEEIARMGRWTGGAMEKAYLNIVSVSGMKALAGFHDQEVYYCKRAAISPPESLASKIFPEIDKVVPTSVNARGFVQLLKWLRIVFLQDSAILSGLFPNHIVFAHELFKDSLYLKFASDVKSG